MMRLFVALGVVLILARCGGGCDECENGPEVAALAGVSAISGALNAVSTAANVFTREHDRTACTTVPAAETCTSGVRKGSYTDCAITNSKHRYTGSVTLTYSDSSCNLEPQASSVTRTLNITRTLVLTTSAVANSQVQTTSENHSDFQGDSWGGGLSLTRTAQTAFEILMPGIRKKRTASTVDKPIYDVTIHHLEPLKVSAPTGTMATGGRTVTGGKLELLHNLAGYIAELVPASLVFEKSECCYPTSGTINVTYTKNLSGSATITFGNALTCGTAIFTREGQSKDIELHGCE